MSFQQATATTSSSLSCCGSLFIISIIFYRGVSTRTDVYLVVLSTFDLLQSLAFACGQTFLPAAGEAPSFACLLQANFIQFFGIAAMLWATFLSWTIVVSLRPGSKPISAQPTRKTLIPFAGTIGTATAFCVTIGANDSFGHATLWCWVVGGKQQLLTYYLPLLLCWCACLVALRVVRREVAARELASVSESERVASALIRQMLLYILVFVSFYAVGLVNRVVHTILSESNCKEPDGSATPGCKVPQLPWLQWLHIFVVPLQGFANAIVYGNLPHWFGLLTGLWRSDRAAFNDGTSKLSFSKFSVEDGFFSPMGEPSAQRVRLFAASWNLGEATPEPHELAAWLPAGRDVYAIGLQECLDVAAFAAAAHEAVGGAARYALYQRAIGSNATSLGYHGYIALLVLVALPLVESGEWAEMAVAKGEVKRGKKIGGHSLANKGAVGMAFRLHDTTIALVGCHLTSDKKGKSQLHKRNEDMRSLLESLEMGYETLGFELQLSCHHIILVGDLNYRVNLPPAMAIGHAAKREWSFLLAAEELRNAMSDGQVMGLWREDEIDFLPTYRRVPRTQPEGTGTVEETRQLFTLEVPGGGERTPSYTDRILVHSISDMASQLRTTGRYTCHEDMTISDHRPVSNEFELSAHRRGAFMYRAPPQVRLAERFRCKLLLHGLNVEWLPTLRGASSASEISSRMSSKKASTPRAPPAGGGAPPVCSSAAIAFPMPSEDPDHSLDRINRILGRRSASAFEQIDWEKLQQPSSKGSVELVAELDPQVARPYHALIMLLDAEGKSLGQAVLAVTPPWVGVSSRASSCISSQCDSKCDENSSRRWSGMRRCSSGLYSQSRKVSMDLISALGQKMKHSAAGKTDRMANAVPTTCDLYARGVVVGRLHLHVLMQWGVSSSSRRVRNLKKLKMATGALRRPRLARHCFNGQITPIIDVTHEGATEEDGKSIKGSPKAPLTQGAGSPRFHLDLCALQQSSCLTTQI